MAMGMYMVLRTIHQTIYLHTYIRATSMSWPGMNACIYRTPCATTSFTCTCVSHLCRDVDEWNAATMADRWLHKDRRTHSSLTSLWTPSSTSFNFDHVRATSMSWPGMNACIYRTPCATTSFTCTCVSHLCRDVDEWNAATMA
jgi:hypothetical protein